MLGLSWQVSSCSAAEIFISDCFHNKQTGEQRWNQITLCIYHIVASCACPFPAMFVLIEQCFKKKFQHDSPILTPCGGLCISVGKGQKRDSWWRPFSRVFFHRRGREAALPHIKLVLRWSLIFFCGSVIFFWIQLYFIYRAEPWEWGCVGQLCLPGFKELWDLKNTFFWTSLLYLIKSPISLILFC